MTERRQAATEWEMAIITALYFWPGTSLTDGAIAILERIHGIDKSGMADDS